MSPPQTVDKFSQAYTSTPLSRLSTDRTRYAVVSDVMRHQELQCLERSRRRPDCVLRLLRQ
jgi:hypothetical protein